MAVDPIISDLQYCMDADQELDILNFYKSFPISCRARVVSIDRDIVELIAQPPGSVCLEDQPETYILSKGLPEAVQAQVISFDLSSGLLKVNDLTYAGSRFGERKIMRVQTDENLPVEIDTGEQHFTGQLIDISLSGVGLLLDDEVLQRGQSLDLTLPLPEGKISLQSTVLNLSPTGEEKVRYSISFARYVQEIGVIMRYIQDRRFEILEEIERMYTEKISKDKGE